MGGGVVRRGRVPRVPLVGLLLRGVGFTGHPGQNEDPESTEGPAHPRPGRRAAQAVAAGVAPPSFRTHV